MDSAQETLRGIDQMLAECHTRVEEFKSETPLPDAISEQVEVALQDVLAAIYAARDVVNNHTSWTGD